MTPYESTRVAITEIVSDFHDTNYPDTEVNYPKRFITDVEHQPDPFVSMELTMELKNMGLKAGHCVRVSGQLILNHWAIEGSGSKLFYEYTDKLQQYLGLQVVNTITFSEVKQFDNSGIPGFDGIMNAVYYQIEYFNV